MKAFLSETADNGSNLIIYNKPSDVVHFRFRFGAGAAFENDANRGIYHLMEHLFFNASSKVDHETFVTQMDKFGASINAYTDYHEVVFTCTVLKENYLEALKLYWDAISTFAPTQKLLDKEREVVFQEIDMRKDNDWCMTYETFYNKVFPQHYVHHPVIGYKNCLSTLTLEDLQQVFNHSFNAPNLTLIVVGDLGDEDEKNLMDFLSRVSPQGEKLVLEVDSEQKMPVSKLARAFKSGMQQTKLLGVMKYDIFKYNSAASVAANLLGGSMSSFIWNEFREKRNLAYQVGSNTEIMDSTTGLLAFYAGLSKEEDTELAETLFGDAIDYLRSTAEEEFEKARTMTLAAFCIGAQSVQKIGGEINNQLFINPEAADIDKFKELLSSLTYEDFMSFANSMDRQNMLFMVYAPLVESKEN